MGTEVELGVALFDIVLNIPQAIDDIVEKLQPS